jgi:glycosyltransferase involved in cell wall biosynthesis
VGGDVDEMAAHFRDLLSDADARLRLGQAGRAHVLAHHRREAMARRYEALYDELL